VDVAPASSSDVVLGVDIGTTSAKAVAFGIDGAAKADAQAGYDLLNPRPGYAEQDARAVAAATLEVTAKAAAAAQEAGHRVAGIAFSAAMHSLVGLDGSGAPVTPLVTWADARAADQARRLRRGRGLALHRRTGTPVHPMSPLVKLRWFAEHDTTARHWVGVKEYVLRELTGELVVDHGIASATGMFNLATEAWDEEALAYAGIGADQLPRLEPTTAVLELSREGAEKVGLPAGTPLVLGSSDGPLANLGLGAVQPGTVACSIGTSGAVRVTTDEPRVDERGRVFCYVLVPGRYVVGGAINNGGIVLDWLADVVAPDVAAEARERGERIPEALLELAGRVPPGSGGLLFLPYLTGERAPHWTPGARGVYLGLTREHRREHLIRAAVEGVCLQLAVVLESLIGAGIAPDAIRATGGFSRSALWRRILADAFGRPVGFASSPEGSSLGAALLGMTALGMLDSIDRAAELVTVSHSEQPDRDAAERYARLLPIFDGAYEALSDAFDALDAAQPELPLTEEDQ